MHPHRHRWTHIQRASVRVCKCVASFNSLILAKASPKSTKLKYIGVLKFNFVPFRSVPVLIQIIIKYIQRASAEFYYISKDDNNKNNNNNNIGTKYRCATENSLMAALCSIVIRNVGYQEEGKWNTKDKAKVCSSVALSLSLSLCLWV